MTGSLTAKKTPFCLLGIESSCDETAAAIVASDKVIHANIIASSSALHAQHGGVVPEIAARAHLDTLEPVISKAFAESGLSWDDIDGVAATGGPGLIGGVLVGTVAAKAMARFHDKPYFAINHLEGHALTARLTNDTPFPYLLLLVSGGHTQLLLVREVGQYERVGTTMDDAAGEAFDKSAKILDLGLPGGPKIEALARQGDGQSYDLPRPLKNKPGCHFSFSGLKTAVLTAYQNTIAPLDDQKAIDQKKADLAASLQRAVAETLASRSRNAMEQFLSDHDVSNPSFVVAGGVAANQLIRQMLTDLALEKGFQFNAPPIGLCTDNAVMIAWAAAERMAADLPADPLDFAPRPRWPLDPEASPPPGRGVRA